MNVAKPGNISLSRAVLEKTRHQFLLGKEVAERTFVLNRHRIEDLRIWGNGDTKSAGTALGGIFIRLRPGTPESEAQADETGARPVHFDMFTGLLNTGKNGNWSDLVLNPPLFSGCTHIPNELLKEPVISVVMPWYALNDNASWFDALAVLPRPQAHNLNDIQSKVDASRILILQNGQGASAIVDLMGKPIKSSEVAIQLTLSNSRH